MPTAPIPVDLWPQGAPPYARDADATDETPRLTVQPLEGRRRACVVVCPGGGYSHRAAHEGGPIATWLNALGVAAAVLDYRVRHRVGAARADALRAIRTVRAHADAWNIDPRRVGILGFSAGGHLAATAATGFTPGDPAAADPVEREDSRPDCAILCYPVITAYERRHHGSIQRLLGPEPWDEASRAAVSLERQVGPRTPPTFLWHTAEDQAVPVDNVLLYAAACAQHRVPFALHVFPHGRHGIGLAAEHSQPAQWTNLCARWLGDLGFL